MANILAESGDDGLKGKANETPWFSSVEMFCNAAKHTKEAAMRIPPIAGWSESTKPSLEFRYHLSLPETVSNFLVCGIQQCTVNSLAGPKDHR